MDITISGNYTLLVPQDPGNYANSVIRIACNTALGPVNITLPSIAALGAQNYTKLIINDAGGLAATNPITIIADALNSINDQLSAVINQNGGGGVAELGSATSWVLTIPTAGLQSVGNVPTVAGAGTGLIKNGNTFVSVPGANPAFFITLPPPVPGQRIIIINTGAGAFKLQSNNPAVVGINGGVGAGKSTSVAGGAMVELICRSTTSWMAEDYDAVGAITATVPAA